MRISSLGDVQLQGERETIARLKGEPYIIFQGQTTDAVSDATLELRDFNAVVIKTLVSGTGVGGPGTLPVADVLLLDSESPSGSFLACSDPQGQQLAVNASSQVTVICGAHYARIELRNVQGTFQGGQGYTVIAWPFVAAGQSRIDVGEFSLPGGPLSMNIAEVANFGVGPANPLYVADTRLPAAFGAHGGVLTESAAPAGIQQVSAADGAVATIGAVADPAATAGNGTVIGLLKQLRALLARGASTAAAALPVTAATDTPGFGGTAALVATIGSGAALSQALDLGAGQAIGVDIPAAWDAADITFAVSTTLAGVYVPLFDSTGTEVRIAAPAVASAYSLAVALAPWRFLQLRSGTNALPVDQTAARAIGVVVK